MKKAVLFIFAAMLSIVSYAQVGVGTENPNAKSMLDVTSDSKGVLLPRLTVSERSAINPGANENGLTIYNITSGCYNMWVWDIPTSTGSWAELCGQVEGLVDFTNCNNIKVTGTYDMESPMKSQSVRISIDVDVIRQGIYAYEATCNGVVFSARGTFTNIGPNTILLFPSGGVPVNAGTFTASVKIAPTNTNGNDGLICTNTEVRFINRSTSTLKILNIGGTENGTGLTSSGQNYTANYQYVQVGNWLKTAAALDYSGTQAIDIVNVPYNSMATLQSQLATASIVWVGASEAYSYGYSQLIKQWFDAGNGIVMVTGDKLAESTVADILGYYIEDGNASLGSMVANSLPEVFSASSGMPYTISNGLQIGYSGSAAGYVSSNQGIAFMTVNGNPAAFADLNRGGFIFGDKFGSGTSVQHQNFRNVLINIFAWSLKNAPVH